MELECGLIELRTPKGKAREATGQSEGQETPDLSHQREEDPGPDVAGRDDERARESPCRVGKAVVSSTTGGMS
jgi:hypothetical protein